MAKTKASMLGMGKRKNKAKPKEKVNKAKLISILQPPLSLNPVIPHRMFIRNRVSFNETADNPIII